MTRRAGLLLRTGAGSSTGRGRWHETGWALAGNLLEYLPRR